VTDKLLDAGRKAVKGEQEPIYTGIVKRHKEILEGLDLPADLAGDLLQELNDLLHGIQMVREVTPRLYDHVASFGERISARTFAAVLRKRGHKEAEAFDAYDLGFATDSRFMNARPTADINERIEKAFAPHKKKLAVVTGFIGTATSPPSAVRARTTRRPSSAGRWGPAKFRSGRTFPA
jgi:aspartate kinase